LISEVWAGADCPVTQPWGETSLTVEPLWNGVHWHCGIDIGMAIGTPLYAARDGWVSYIGYGLLAISGPDYTDWYVHIDRAYPYLKAPINKGNLVAWSGAKVPSGGSLTGPHLHFEVQQAASALLGEQALGFLNYPASSLDPVPILTGGDMPLDPADPIVVEMRTNIAAIYAIVSGSRLGGKATDQALRDIEAEVKALPSGGTGGGGTEPPEPAEPKTITLDIPSVPGKATGTIS
jgi:hypothetical protein